MVEQTNPERYKKLVAEAERIAKERFALYEHLARAMNPANLVPGAAAAAAAVAQPKAKA
jgi:pyruvate-ferredoxin/flavodoxin oxidoreductase